VSLASSGSAAVGETASVTLSNGAAQTARGELSYEPSLLQLASGEAAAGGRVPFELAPGAEKVLVFRVLPAARGRSIEVRLGSVTARRPDGSGVLLPSGGSAAIEVNND
jgi:hypothetical protein